MPVFRALPLEICQKNPTYKTTKKGLIMAPIPNVALALKRQQLIEDNKQLENQNETLQNEISKAQNSLNSLHSDISAAKQDFENYEHDKKRLSSDINALKQEKSVLLTEIGEQNNQGEFPEGTLKHKKSKLETEIVQLDAQISKQRQQFETEQQQMVANFDAKNKQLEAEERKHKEEIATRQKQLDDEYQKHKAEVHKNVNIINNVKDFKQETVKNMRFYGWCMIIAMLIMGLLCRFSFHNISETLSLFSKQLAVGGTNLIPNGWNWIYAALSIAIVKLPNALLFVGVLAVLYKMFSVLFGVYEKINAEKRKISTIEALINHMNEQSVAIILEREIDFKNAEQIANAKADLKWQILSDYFSKSPVESDNSDSATKRENKVLREIFLNKHKIYGVDTPLGGAHMEEKSNTK